MKSQEDITQSSTILNFVLGDNSVDEIMNIILFANNK